MENYDPEFGAIAQADDILVISGLEKWVKANLGL